MSIITLETAKQYLDVIHNADDAKLQLLLDAAENEAAEFCNRDLDDWDDVPSSFVLGVMLLLQAAYQASPDDAAKLRQAAEVKLMPHRICMGV